MGTDLWQQTVTFAVEGVPVPKARVLRSDQAYDEVRARAPGPARCRKQAAAITGEIAPQKNSSQNWAQRSCAQSSRSTGSSHTPTTSGYYLEILEDDPRAIFTAAARAQSAVDFLRQQLLASPQRILRLPFEASKLTTGGAACVNIFATTAASLSSTMTEVTRSLSRP